MVAYAEGKL